MNKQILINVEQKQFTARVAQKYLMLCCSCGETVDLVTFAEAGEILNASIEEIITCAASRAIHLIVHSEALLVCLNSLLTVRSKARQKQLARPSGERRLTLKPSQTRGSNC